MTTKETAICGLFGYAFDKKAAAKKRHQVRTLFCALAVLNDQRGGQGWGLYSPPEDRIVKGVGKAQDMGRTAADFGAGCHVLIGHTRWGTTGKEKKRNSHPFDVMGVVGAHNGVVHNHHELNKLYGRRCEVDSEHLFHHIAEGRDDEEVLAYGAIALSGPGEDAAWVGHFNDGELAAAEVKGLGWAWSSSWRHLESALAFSDLEHEEVYSDALDEGVLYKVTPAGPEFARKLGYQNPWGDPDMRGWAGTRDGSYDDADRYTADELDAMEREWAHRNGYGTGDAK